MTFDSNSFAKALLNNEDIKRNLIRERVKDACLKARFLSPRDIATNSIRYIEVNEVVEDQLTCAGLLKQIMLHHAKPEDDHDELFKNIVRDIVDKILSSRSSFSKR